MPASAWESLLANETHVWGGGIGTFCADGGAIPDLEYSQDAGTNWTTVGNEGNSTNFELPAKTLIRFSANARFKPI